MSATVQSIIAMAIYLAAMLLIGIIFAKRASSSSDEYFLGGRGLGPWVAAFSAEASDMSGWLLMGLPGVAFFSGLADAFWTAVGLALGTYLNWLIVSKRLRRYSQVANNSITLPDFFSNRFKEKKPVILLVSSLFILVFFAVYVASCFVTGGKLFAQLFGASYHSMLITAAVFVIAYTLLGGFWAESISDFVQAIIMIVALLAVVIFGVVYAGGFGAVIDNIKNIPGFLDFFGMAKTSTLNGNQIVLLGERVEWSATPTTYGALTIASTMAWGLGYFGMPQVLLRFFAIRKVKELVLARRVAIIWCVVAMAAAVFIGLMGRAIFPAAWIGSSPVGDAGTFLFSAADAENVFIKLSQMLFNPLFAGLVMAGILAAAMSSSDSYLLIASSAVSKNIYKGALKREATDKQVMMVSRLTLCLIAVIGLIIAWDENSVIFKVVSFAWAGFGAAFGPLVLFSLFWKRTTRTGAIAGIVGGGLMVFVWKLVIRPLGGGFDIYELLPAFIFGCICIIVASLATPKPEKAILDEFEQAKTLVIE
ncbi:MAG: sodium/proline symporter PutP [Oscillospiraceae bacterium]|jgi:sodium/proline symporter|nr:sodium/proline symporter PutP [Oscillospiraceae bacterium]